jgi:hypothetical protein
MFAGFSDVIDIFGKIHSPRLCGLWLGTAGKLFIFF